MIDKFKTCKLLDLVDIERAKKGKIYPADCVLVQVSATKGQLVYLAEPSEVESMYAVMQPKQVYGNYLYHILTEAMPGFLEKYQTGLNIQPDIFKNMQIEIHEDIEDQKAFARILNGLDESARLEQLIIDSLKEFKRVQLDKMFPNGK